MARVSKETIDLGQTRVGNGVAWIEAHRLLELFESVVHATLLM